MATTHAQPDTFAELQATFGDLGPQVIVSHSGLTVPASSLTLAAVAANGYVLSAGPPARLVYVSQPAVSVTLSATNGPWWLALHADLHTPVSGWTRRSGSHYLTQQAATQPANPSQSLCFAQVTVSGGVITAVSPLLPVTSPPMSKQNSNAVAITGGTAALSGTLDGSHTLTATGRLKTTGITVLDYAGNNVNTYYTNLAAAGGTNRYALRCEGDAPSLLGGPLQVNGLTQFLTGVGFQGTPVTSMAQNVRFAKASQVGARYMPTDSDTGQAAVRFDNLGGSPVGSITTTSTATAYNTSSDRRLKTDIAGLRGALAVLMQLRPVAFTWHGTQERGAGLLADEVQRVVPQAVTGHPGAVDAAGQVLPQGLDYSKLVVWLLAGMQEILARLEALEARLAAS